MNGQMLNSKRYEESLQRCAAFIPPIDPPKIKMDLRGLSRYAKEKGIAACDLSEEEKNRFLYL